MREYCINSPCAGCIFSTKGNCAVKLANPEEMLPGVYALALEDEYRKE